VIKTAARFSAVQMSLLAHCGHSLRCDAMSAFGGKADIGQPLRIGLDFMSTRAK
jgi:hypothetical protein